MGSTRVMRGKLSTLRGEGAKKALDARVLAETAIQSNALLRKVQREIKVPEQIPSEVAKLMKDNELENATIVFSHEAMQLFSYVFGQAMNSAVKEAMEDMESVIERVVERKLTETLTYGAEAIRSLLSPPTQHNERDMQKDAAPAPQKLAEQKKKKIPRGGIKGLILWVLTQSKTPLSLKDISAELEKTYLLKKTSVSTSVLVEMMKQEGSPVRRVGRGVYTVHTDLPQEKEV